MKLRVDINGQPVYERITSPGDHHDLEHSIVKIKETKLEINKFFEGVKS